MLRDLFGFTQAQVLALFVAVSTTVGFQASKDLLKVEPWLRSDHPPRIRSLSRCHFIFDGKSLFVNYNGNDRCGAVLDSSGRIRFLRSVDGEPLAILPGGRLLAVHRPHEHLFAVQGPNAKPCDTLVQHVAGVDSSGSRTFVLHDVWSPAALKSTVSELSGCRVKKLFNAPVLATGISGSDRRTIALTSEIWDQRREANLHRLTIFTARGRVLGTYRAPDNVSLEEPAFTRNGRYVYFVRYDQAREIWRLDTRSWTSVKLSLGIDGSDVTSPTVGADGKTLAFIVEGQQVFRVSLNPSTGQAVKGSLRLIYDHSR